MTGKRRLAFFISGLWLFLIALISSDGYSYQWGLLFGLGVFPLFLGWGLKWVLEGFSIHPIEWVLKKRKPQVSAPQMPPSDPANPPAETIHKNASEVSLRSKAVLFLQKGAYYVVFFIALVSAKVVVKELLSSKKPSPQQIEQKMSEALQEAAKKLNAGSPVMIDQDTRLDRVATGPGIKITYFHTLVNSSYDDYDHSKVEPEFYRLLSTRLCAEEKHKTLFEYGGSMAYSYATKEGRHLATISISKKDCWK